MTYSDSIWTGDGWVGRVCADPECSVILHQTARVHPTEEGAGFAAFVEWSALDAALPVPDGIVRDAEPVEGEAA